MKPSEHDLPKTDRKLLDILVDGELTEVERRDLLRRLDRTPDGWRACALAFLEAQCFRESFGKIDVQPVSPSKVLVPRGVQRIRWAGRVGTLVAMAASFLTAVGLGWWAGGLQRSGGPTRLAPNSAADLLASSQGTPVPSPSPSADPQSVAPPRPEPMMTLALPGWGEGGPIQLPVVERDQADPSFLYPDSHAFPAQLREALRRAGYRVRQSHDLVPVPVQDGRHAILPVDQLDIHYVGNHVE
jgi:hypothetical protein